MNKIDGVKSQWERMNERVSAKQICTILKIIEQGVKRFKQEQQQRKHGAKVNENAK